MTQGISRGGELKFCVKVGDCVLLPLPVVQSVVISHSVFISFFHARAVVTRSSPCPRREILAHF
jgi:hypothetical protein